jgi:hypothetical protein
MNTLVRHGRDALLLEEVDGKLARRPSAGVQAVKFAGLGVPIEKEEIAADTVHHWFSHTEDGVRGNGCVDGGAATAEYVCAHLRGQILAGGRDAAAGYDHGAAVGAVLGEGADR